MCERCVTRVRTIFGRENFAVIFFVRFWMDQGGLCSVYEIGVEVLCKVKCKIQLIAIVRIAKSGSNETLR